MDLYFLGLLSLAMIIPLVHYLLSKLKKDYTEIGGFRFVEIRKDGVLISYERHSWPSEESSTMIKTNGEVWISGKKTKNLNERKLKKIQNEIKESGFFNLPKVISEKFQDGSVEVWYANINGKQHKVYLRIFDEQKRPEAVKKMEHILGL